jgi:hypothetical protein
MGGTCGIEGGKQEVHTNVWLEDLKQSGLEGAGIDSILLGCTLQKSVWAALNWHKTGGSNDTLLWTWWRIFWFHKSQVGITMK